jgi:hypothetical protein
VDRLVPCCMEVVGQVLERVSASWAAQHILKGDTGRAGSCGRQASSFPSRRRNLTRGTPHAAYPR